MDALISVCLRFVIMLRQWEWPCWGSNSGHMIQGRVVINHFTSAWPTTAFTRVSIDLFRLSKWLFRRFSYLFKVTDFDSMTSVSVGAVRWFKGVLLYRGGDAVPVHFWLRCLFSYTKRDIKWTLSIFIYWTFYWQKYNIIVIQLVTYVTWRSHTTNKFFCISQSQEQSRIS